MIPFKNETTDYADGHGYSHNAKGSAWASQAGAAFSNPFSSALARNCENSAFTRYASALAFRALREIKNCQELASRKNTG